jgi:hypothetical protein
MNWWSDCAVWPAALRMSVVTGGGMLAGARRPISHRETRQNILCRIAAELTRINPRT